MAIFNSSAAAPVAFAANPTFSIPFEPKTITLINESNVFASAVEFSLDGVNVHGKLIPTVLGSIELTQHVQNVWLRGAAVSVQIIAQS